MSRVHPGEAELARWGDGEARTDIVAHVRWCARCRSAVADYRWLTGEIGATLTAAADAVKVPRPQWWAVQERLLAGQQRRVAGWRSSALASVVLAVSLMLSLSPILPPALGTAVAVRTPRPEAVLVPAPLVPAPLVPALVTAAVPGTQQVAWGATPTPILSGGEATPAPTPAFVLPPTPPEPETL
jgi:hypothetical protein